MDFSVADLFEGVKWLTTNYGGAVLFGIIGFGLWWRESKRHDKTRALFDAMLPEALKAINKANELIEETKLTLINKRTRS